MALDLGAFRARAEAATEGPWTWASHTTADGDEWAVFDPADHALASNRDGWAPDAEFIAHARSDIPALLDEVERVRVVRNIWRKRANRAEAALARVRALVADTGNTSTGPTYALCADVLAAIERTAP